MLPRHEVSRGFVDPIARVVEAALSAAREIAPDHIMVVGAWCRDILHYSEGHTFSTAATRDLDLALALSSWDAYHALATSFPRVGNSRIRFRIADTDVDLLPFGDVEDPQGVVEPPTRDEPLSVWAFDEIFDAADPLNLTDTLTIRIPTVAGYAAAKLGAWLDRSLWHEVKDAADLALTLYWYAESEAIRGRLYETEEGNELLLAEDADVSLAAAHLLGADIVSVLGTRRQAELLSRWPCDRDQLAKELRLHGGNDRSYGSTLNRRRNLVDALTRGLSS